MASFMLRGFVAFLLRSLSAIVLCVLLKLEMGLLIAACWPVARNTQGSECK